MKQILPILIFLFFAFPASSKWKKKYMKMKLSLSIFEVDAVKKIGEIIYLWSMRDFKRSQKNGNLSTKFLLNV